MKKLDLSAAEIKMVAGTANEETMIQAFKDGLDIHNFNASKIFNIPIEEVNKNQRKIAKGVSFGILYGSTVKALNTSIITAIPIASLGLCIILTFIILI